MMSGRKVLVSMAPRWVRRAWRGALGWRWFEGNYTSWEEARLVATGYDDEQIAQRVLAATNEVRTGKAAFERDSVTFKEFVPEEGLIEGLRRVLAANQSLRVLDFGGALGSTYWRHRAWLETIPHLVWDVVEQPVFAKLGREHLQGTRLRFFSSVEEAIETNTYDVILASCVVQYLENPTEVIESWMKARQPWLLFNNLPLHSTAADRICIQRVPPTIYDASYPVWFFNREKFLNLFSDRYALEYSFASEAVWPMGWHDYPSTGLLFRRLK